MRQHDILCVCVRSVWRGMLDWSLLPDVFCLMARIFRFMLVLLYIYTGCPRRNGQNFGRVFLMLKYTDITQNTYIQS